MSKRLFYTKLAWHSEDKQEIERSLKLFALINNDLVIPSNHLYSPNAEFFFNHHPELLENKIIRPALDSQYESYSAYFDEREGKAGRNLSKYGEFLDSLESSPIKYSDTSPAGIFTACAIEQLENPKSVLAESIKYDFSKAQKLTDFIHNTKQSTNGVIYYEDFLNSARSIFTAQEFIIIDKFAQLNRYIAGASSKNCNNLLPQENLIDWCLANPDNPSESILSDEQVFWEVFIESLVKVTDGIFSLQDIEKLSPKVLDKFSFEDIQEFRSNGVLHNKFVSKYDSIINKVNDIKKTSVHNVGLVDIDYLINTKAQLKAEFEESLYEESSLYTELELIDAMLKVAYQLWGGAFQTIESVVNFFSVAIGKKKQWQSFLTKQEQRVNVASRFVAEKASGQSVLIEYMEQILKKSKEAWHK